MVVVLYGPDGVARPQTAQQPNPTSHAQSKPATPAPAAPKLSDTNTDSAEATIEQALKSGQSLKQAIEAAKKNDPHIEGWLVAQAATVAQERIAVANGGSQNAQQRLSEALKDVRASGALDTAAVDEASKILTLAGATTSASGSATGAAPQDLSTTLGDQIATQLASVEGLDRADDQHTNELMQAVLNTEKQLQIQRDDGGGSTAGDSTDFSNAVTAAGMIAETKILTSSTTDPVLKKTAAAQLIGQDLIGIAQGGDPSRQAALESLLLDSAYTKDIGRGVSTLGLALQSVDASTQLDATQKGSLEQAIVDSNAAKALGADEHAFLKNYLGTMQRAKANPNDLDATAAATYANSLVSYGDTVQSASGAKLDNLIGAELGVKPTHQPKTDADRAAVANGAWELYSGDDLKTIHAITQHLSGKQMRSVQALFVPRGKSTVQQYPLWAVVDGKGKTTGYVDYAGRTYTDLNDFMNHNKLGFGKLVVADGGQLTVTHGGGIATVSHEHKKGFWDYVDQYGGELLDGAALVGGVALMFTGAGSALGVAIVATMVADGVYKIGSGVSDLADRGAHGQSVGFNADTMGDYVNIAGGLAAGVAGGAPKIAAMAVRSGADGIATGARVANAAATGVNVGIAGYSGYQVATNWDNMSTTQRIEAGASLALALASSGKPAMKVGRTAMGFAKTKAGIYIADPVNAGLARLPSGWTNGVRQTAAALQPSAIASRLASVARSGVAARAAARADTSTNNTGPQASRVGRAKNAALTTANMAWTRTRDAISTTGLTKGGTANRRTLATQKRAVQTDAAINRADAQASADTLAASLRQAHSDLTAGSAAPLQQATRLQTQIESLIAKGASADAPEVQTRLAQMRTLAGNASSNAPSWHNDLAALASNESKALARQMKNLRGNSDLTDSLRDARLSTRDVRNQAKASARALRTSLAGSAAPSGAAPIDEANALVSQLSVHANDLRAGVQQVDALRGQMQQSKAEVYDYVDPKTNQSIRDKLAAQIYVDPSDRLFTWKDLLGSPMRQPRALNRFAAGKAQTEAASAKTAAKAASDKSNASKKLDAWNMFVQAVVRERAGEPGFNAAQEGLVEGAYQNGATGSVRRWKQYATGDASSAAYNKLVQAARAASSSGTVKAASAATKAWLGAQQQSATAQRIADSVRREYEAYLREHGIAPDQAETAAASSPALQALRQRAQLTQAASEYTQRGAASAYRAVFGDQGALEQLRDTNPAAYRRLLSQTSDRATLLAARYDGGDATLNALVDDLNGRAATAQQAAPSTRNPFAADSIEDAGLTVQKILSAPRKLAPTASFYHGAVMLATGQVVVSFAPEELKKYNVATKHRLDGWQITIKTKDGLNTVSFYANLGGLKTLWLGGGTPFAFSRNGTTTFATRDGVSLFEAGAGWRFGTTWLNKLDYMTMRVGYLKNNTARLNLKNGAVSGMDTQFTWSWPITLNTMDATDIGPLRAYNSFTGNRIQIASLSLKGGFNAKATGPDYTASPEGMISALTVNKEDPLSLPPLPMGSVFLYDGVAPAIEAVQRAPVFLPQLAKLDPLTPRSVDVTDAGNASTAWSVASAHWRTLLSEQQRQQAAAEHLTTDEIVARYALPELEALNQQIAEDPSRIDSGTQLNVLVPSAQG
jgi:hypothetical protein